MPTRKSQSDLLALMRQERENAGAAVYRLLAGSVREHRSKAELDALAAKLAQLGYFSEPGRRAMLTGDVMQVMEAERVHAGTVIVRQGEAGSTFYVVLEGHCSVHYRSGERSKRGPTSPQLSRWPRTRPRSRPPQTPRRPRPQPMGGG